ncbi:MAG: COX15/CtaA family protein [Dokdonella sp.]
MNRRTLSWPARLAWTAVALALIVIVFGAFVRLSNAGLSCPDWPTCYGKATWPGHENEIAQANANYDREVESHKTWREQGHRHIAALLGVLILGIALVAAGRPRSTRFLVLLAAIAAAAGVFTYMRGLLELSFALSLVALALPLIAAAMLQRPGASRVGVALLSVVIFQAMLGMWTVTWLLKPVVVMSHLLGGLTTFSLLLYVALRWSNVGSVGDDLRGLRRMIAFAIVVLGAQIALGGWTSANYAALACGNDFPTCLDQWWPTTDFGEGFVLWRGIGVDYEGGVLDGAARSAIQISHRIGALVAFVTLGWLCGKLARSGLRVPARVLGIGLLVQIALGIGNVVYSVPLPIATAHVAVAVLLLATLVYTLARSQPRIERSPA